MTRELTQLKSILGLILISFILMACEKPVVLADPCVMPGDQSVLEQSEADEGLEARECTLPTQDPTAKLVIDFQLRDFSKEKEAKFNDASERLLLVINSLEFKEEILNHLYQDEERFVDNDDLTNEEVYEKIMLGAETLDPLIDHEVDLDVTLYYKNNSTVGYTYTNTNRIWVNDKFFSKNSLGKVAANLMHEWLHKIGFTHDHSSTARRPYSVPYAVGNIVRELVDGM